MKRADRRAAILLLSIALLIFLIYMHRLPHVGWFMLLFWIIDRRMNSQLGGLWNQKDSGLDERQLAVKNRAYRLSYRTIIHAATVYVFFMLILSYVREMELAKQYIQILSLVFIAFVVGLPKVIIAWIEPEALPHDTTERGKS